MTATTLPAGRRALTRDHIAFYRAVMEGVDSRAAWERYLGFDGEFTEAASSATLIWVRQALVAEAVGAGQPGLIGLFRRDPRHLRAPTRPTLDEFAARLDDAGAWSEAELVEMWQAEVGAPDRAEARRARLSQRLRESLLLLERGERRRPAPGDAVGQWLAPHLATRLAAAGIATLGAARAALDARHTPRWDEVPGIGAVWADRLRGWFEDNAITTPVAPAVLPPNPLLPLERFVTSPGQTTRAPDPGSNALVARDDKQAIELWLDAKAGNPHTRRAYRRSAERLLLWCQLERRSTLAALTVADCRHYRAWLGDLGRQSPEAWADAGWRIPAEQWIGRRAARRDSADWRPFDGPLAPNSVAQELLTLRSLFAFLLRERVVAVNVWDQLGEGAMTRARRADAAGQFVDRSFTLNQWKNLIDGLDPQGPELERRLLLVLWLGFACGLRAAEMLSLTLGSIVPAPDAWQLRVIGKGDTVRVVPLPAPARTALLAYLDAVGVDCDALVRAASADEDSPESAAPLLRARRGRRRADGPAPVDPLRHTRLYGLLKAHLATRADALAEHDADAAATFRRASTHWLRHTCATLALRHGVALDGVRRLLGHSTLGVTSAYLAGQGEALQASMEDFAARAAR